MISLVEDIVETDEKTLESVYTQIESAGKLIELIYSIIKHALIIRPFHTESLLSLFCLLATKYGYDDDATLYSYDWLITTLINQGLIPQENAKTWHEKSICYFRRH